MKIRHVLLISGKIWPTTKIRNCVHSLMIGVTGQTSSRLGEGPIEVAAGDESGGRSIRRAAQAERMKSPRYSVSQNASWSTSHQPKAIMPTRIDSSRGAHRAAGSWPAASMSCGIGDMVASIVAGRVAMGKRRWIGVSGQDIIAEWQGITVALFGT